MGVAATFQSLMNGLYDIVSLKDVRGWQFLTIEVAETLRVVCLPPDEHIFRKKYFGDRPFKKSHSISV